MSWEFLQSEEEARRLELLVTYREILQNGGDGSAFLRAHSEE